MCACSLFDSHCDTATELWRRKETLYDNSCCVDLSQSRAFSNYAQFFAFCTYSGLDKAYSPSELLWRPYNYLMGLISKTDFVQLCINGSELNGAWRRGQTAVFLSLEGAEGIDCDPGRLEDLRMKGFTMVNLTWNKNNCLAGCSAENGEGLTKMGRDFVQRAQKLGILIDASHISDKAFWDIMDLTEAPIVASHSNCRGLCHHNRNLTDEQIKAIAETGGFVGINLYSDFLSSETNVSFEHIYAHIDHVVSLCGDNHAALGGDLDGCDRLPAGLEGLKDYEKISDLLKTKGYSNDAIENIFSNTIKEVVTLCTM